MVYTPMFLPHTMKNIDVIIDVKWLHNISSLRSHCVLLQQLWYNKFCALCCVLHICHNVAVSILLEIRVAIYVQESWLVSIHLYWHFWRDWKAEKSHFNFPLLISLGLRFIDVPFSVSHWRCDGVFCSYLANKLPKKQQRFFWNCISDVTHW